MRKLLTLCFTLCILTVDAQNWDRAMRLKNISVEIKADHFTAQTFIEMEFFNDGEREMEGLYTFSLLPHQVITAFQLDLFGKYRDGSIEEKWKATNAYNRIVGKRIDPALLTMDHPGSYRLRIYPVPAKSSRKITMTIQEILQADSSGLKYKLPLLADKKIEVLSISIKVPGNTTITGNELLKGQQFEHRGTSNILAAKLTNLELKSAISFSIPFTGSASYVQNRPNNYAFALRTLPDNIYNSRGLSKKITVYWDVSASGNKRDIKKEIDFLKQYVKWYDIKEMELIRFNHQIVSQQTIISPGSQLYWAKQLQNEYAGATQLGIINHSGNATDPSFIFTDGHNTYGSKSPIGLNGLVYTVTSNLNYDSKTLAELSGIGGGHLIDLNKKTISQAIVDCNMIESWLLEVSSASGKIIIDQSLPMVLNAPILLNGTLQQMKDTIYLKYGTIQNHRTIAVVVEAGTSAQDISRIGMLNRFQHAIRFTDWESVLDFGITEKVVTPNTAYLVLERVEDYARYNIAPPKELEAECKKINYIWRDTRRTRLAASKKNDEYTILSRLVDAYNKRILQWDPQATPLQLEKVKVETNSPTKEPSDNESNITGKLSGSAPGIAINNALEEVVVTAYGASRKVSLTSAYTVVRTHETTVASGTIEQALQGRVAGVQVMSSAQPGSTPLINIRGAASINPNNQPLWILDGMPITGNINDVINLNDINDITVLKGNAATALYGSRAAHGAIVVTSTKSNHRYFYWNDHRPYKLKDMEDVGYIQAFKVLNNSEKLDYYQVLKKEYEGQVGFMLDITNLFYQSGMRKEAKDVLMNAIEAANGQPAALTAAGYICEQWKDLKEAIFIYKSLITDYPENLPYYRNLAWAYYQDGQYQQAVNSLYAALKRDLDDDSIKVMLLTEMNAIIGAHQPSIDVSAIPAGIIFNMPLDNRMVLDCNTGIAPSTFIKEPNSQKAGTSTMVTNNESYFYSIGHQWHQRYAEYFQKKQIPGKYRLGVFFYSYWNNTLPNYVRIMRFNNFGKPNQSVSIENIVLDNQYGEIEIADWKW